MKRELKAVRRKIFSKVSFVSRLIPMKRELKEDRRDAGDILPAHSFKTDPDEKGTERIFSANSLMPIATFQD